MAQQFLLDNIKAFLSLLGKLEEGVVMHKQDTSIIYANPSAATILGLSEEELLGESASSHEWYFIDENHKRLEIAEYPVNKLLRSKKNITHMLLGVRSSKNNLKWIDVNGSITINEFHEPIALITFTDVTSRKEAFDEAELFKNLVEIVDTGITISDPNLSDNPLIYANKAFSKITGYSLEEATHKNCRYLQAQDTDQKAIALLRKAVLEEKACEVILRNYKKDGTLFYNLLNISPFFQEQKLKYFVGVQHDVTKQIEQEQKLQEQALYIQSILDAQENIVFVSNGVQISYANKALFEFYDFADMQSFLEQFFCICHTFLEDADSFHLTKKEKNQNWIEAMLLLDESKRMVALKNKEDKTRYFKVEIKPIAFSFYVITLIHITHSRQRELLLQNKAYHDPLTGAYNRQYFYEFVLQKSLNEEEMTGIIILDIDNFKKINDTFGHGIGDEVLKRLASTLQSSLRPSDYLIRWGGEEFVVISKTKKVQDIATIAENLRKAVAMIAVEKVGSFTASFGTANMQKDENIDSAIQRADSALYEAKARGKNRVERA